MERRFQVSGKITPARERVAAFLRERGYATTPHTTVVALQLRSGRVGWAHHVSWNRLTHIKHLGAWLDSLEKKAMREMREKADGGTRRSGEAGEV